MRWWASAFPSCPWSECVYFSNGPILNIIFLLETIIFVEISLSGPKKRQYQESPNGSSDGILVASLEQTIFSLGNVHPSISPKEDLERTAQILLEPENEKYLQSVCESIAICCLELPHKMHSYISLLKLLRSEFVRAVLEQIALFLEKSLFSKGPWRHFVQSLRFLATCSKERVFVCTDGTNSLSSFYQRIIDQVGSFLSMGSVANNDNLYSCDFLFWSLCIALMHDVNQSEFMGPLKELMASRKTVCTSSYGDSHPSLPKDLSNVYQCVLEDLAKSKEIYAKNDYSGESVNFALPDSVLYFVLEDLVIDGSWNDDFEILEAEMPRDNEELDDSIKGQNTHKIVFNLRLLLLSMDFNHRKCAESLLAACEGNFSLLAKFLIGELVIQVRSQNHLDSNDLAPCLSPLPPVSYENLLIDCCRVEKSFPPAMAKFVNVIVLDRLAQNEHSFWSFVRIERLARWFAHHLSNFRYKWNWERWDSIADLPFTNLASIFVQSVIRELLSLSFYEHIVTSFPERIRKRFLLPLRPANVRDGSGGEQQDSMEKVTGSEMQEVAGEERSLFDSINKAILERNSSVQIKTQVLQLKESAPSISNINEAKIVLKALLSVCKRSLSHCLSVIERYLDLFKIVSASLMLDAEPLDSNGTNQEGLGMRLMSNASSESSLLLKASQSKAFIDEIYRFWSENAFYFSFIIERLIAYRILLPISVLKWSFDTVNDYALIGSLEENSRLTEVLYFKFSTSLIFGAIEQSRLIPIMAGKKLKGVEENDSSHDSDERVLQIVNKLEEEFRTTVCFALSELQRISSPPSPSASNPFIKYLGLGYLQDLSSMYPQLAKDSLAKSTSPHTKK